MKIPTNDEADGAWRFRLFMQEYFSKIKTNEKRKLEWEKTLSEY